MTLEELGEFLKISKRCEVYYLSDGTFAALPLLPQQVMMTDEEYLQRKGLISSEVHKADL